MGYPCNYVKWKFKFSCIPTLHFVPRDLAVYVIGNLSIFRFFCDVYSVWPGTKINNKIVTGQPRSAISVLVECFGQLPTILNKTLWPEVDVDLSSQSITKDEDFGNDWILEIWNLNSPLVTLTRSLQLHVFVLTTNLFSDFRLFRNWKKKRSWTNQLYDSSSATGSRACLETKWSHALLEIAAMSTCIIWNQQ